jgi:O-acetyl-ADP-ribose deacetylase
MWLPGCAGRFMMTVAMVEINVEVGDLLDEVADVIVASGNPWLNMSGGVNGAILARGGEAIQEELRAHLRDLGKPAVVPGTVVATGPGPLRAKKILHAVAIDPFYDSSVEMVRETVEHALTLARELGAKSVAMPALATGYGHLSIEQFAEAFARSMLADWSPIERIAVIVRNRENAIAIQEVLALKGR